MAVPLEILDCFEILGIPPGAHPGEIRSAFRRLALSFHPDVAGAREAGRFEAIAAAYAVLKSASPGEVADALKKGRKSPDAAPGRKGKVLPSAGGERDRILPPFRKEKRRGGKLRKGPGTARRAGPGGGGALGCPAA